MFSLSPRCIRSWNVCGDENWNPESLSKLPSAATKPIKTFFLSENGALHENGSRFFLMVGSDVRIKFFSCAFKLLVCPDGRGAMQLYFSICRPINFAALHNEEERTEKWVMYEGHKFFSCCNSPPQHDAIEETRRRRRQSDTKRNFCESERAGACYLEHDVWDEAFFSNHSRSHESHDNVKSSLRRWGISDDVSRSLAK